MTQLTEEQVREWKKAAQRTLATFDDSSYAASEARRASQAVVALADAYLAQQTDELATARIAAAGMALAEAVLARMALFKDDPHRAYLETLAENVYAAVEARKRSRAAVSVGSPETRETE